MNVWIYTLNHDRHILREYILTRQRNKPILIPSRWLLWNTNWRNLAGMLELFFQGWWQEKKNSSKFCNVCCSCFRFQIIFHRSYNTCWDNKSQGLFPICLRGCLSGESECESVCLTCWQGNRQVLYIVFASTLKRKVERKGEEEVCVNVCDWEMCSNLRRLLHWADVIVRISS